MPTNNDTSWHPCAFETKPGNAGNPGGAGRASSALALADAVVTDAVLVEDFVVDLALVMLVDGFVDDVAVVMPVDGVVGVVQLEVGVLDSTQHMLLPPLFCKGILRVASWTCYLAALGLSKVEGVPTNDLSTGLGPAFICFPAMKMFMNPIVACGAHAFHRWAQCMFSPVTMGHTGSVYIYLWL